MRQPRVRFTVRGLMVVVAIAAVSLGVVLWARRMRGRSSEYRARVKELALQERFWIDQFDGAVARNKRYRGSDHPAVREMARRADGAAVEARKRIDYFADLRRKYERATVRPWLPVESDPPPPR